MDQPERILSADTSASNNGQILPMAKYNGDGVISNPDQPKKTKEQKEKERENARKQAAKKLLLNILGRKLNSIAKNENDAERLKKLQELKESNNDINQLLQSIAGNVFKGREPKDAEQENFKAALRALKADSVDILLRQLKQDKLQKGPNNNTSEANTNNGNSEKPIETAETLEQYREQKSKPPSLIAALAAQPRAILENRLIDVERKLNFQGQTVGLNSEGNIYQFALELERDQLKAAIIQRELTNFEVAAKFIALNIEDDERFEQVIGKGESGELKSRVRQLAQDLQNSSAKENDEDLPELRQRVEKLRIGVDQYYQIDQGSQEKAGRYSEHLAEVTGADKHRTLREVVDLLPKTQGRLLREKAGKGDEQALDEYLNILLRNQDFNLNIGLETDDSTETVSYKKRLRQLTHGKTLEGLDAEEKIELYALASSMSLQLDSAELVRKMALTTETSSQTKKIFSGLSIPQVERLAYLVGLDPTTEIDQPLLAQKITDLVEKYNETLINQDKNGQELTDYLSRAENILRADLEDFRTFNDMESKLAQLKLDLTGDILDQWSKRTSAGIKRDQQTEEVGLKSPDFDLNLTVAMMRTRLNFYGLIDHDFDNLAEVESIKSRARDNLKASGGSEEIDLIDEAFTEARNGEYRLYTWANQVNQLDPDQQLQRKKVANALELAFAYPQKSRGKDANNNEVLAADPRAAKLYEELLTFRQVDEGVEKFWHEKAKASPEGQALYNYVGRNLIFNRFLATPNLGIDRSQLEEIFNDESLDLLTQEELLTNLTAKIEGLVLTNNANNPRAQMTKLLRENQVVKFQDQFDIERVPGGIAIRVMDGKKVGELLGIENLDENIQGANFRENNILNRTSFPGGIVVINEASSKHEISHLLERHVKQLINQPEAKTSPKNNDYYALGIDEINARLVSPDSDLSKEGEIPKLIDLNLVPVGLTPQTSNSELTQLLSLTGDNSETKAQQKIYTVLRMVDQIIKENTDKLSPEELLGLKSLLQARLYALGNEPEKLIRDLHKSFPEVAFADLSFQNRLDLESSLGQSKSSEEFATRIFTEYIKPVSGEALNVYTGERLKSNEDHTSLKTDLLKLNDANKVFQFAMKYGGKAVPTRFLGIQTGTKQTDTWAQKDTNFGVKPADIYSYPYMFNKNARESLTDELNPTIKLSGLLNKKSYFKQDAILDFVDLGKKGPGKVLAETVINPLIDTAIKRVLPINSRDFADSFSGRSKWISDYRSSSVARMQGMLAPGGRWREFQLIENRKGYVEEGRYPGYQLPEQYRNMWVKDRHLAVISALQENLQGMLSSGELYSLFEKHPLMALQVVPGDRPAFSPEIDVEKADKISQSDFERMGTSIFNLNDIQESVYKGKNNGGAIKVGGDKHEVITDSNGNFRVIINGKQYPVSQETLIKYYGANRMKSNDGESFYKEWRSQKVEYKGQQYYVHYDPKTGLPGLYKEEGTEFSKGAKPLTDKNGDIIPPKYGKTKREGGSELREREYEVATCGLYGQIMRVRTQEIERQYKEFLAEKRKLTDKEFEQKYKSYQLKRNVDVSLELFSTDYVDESKLYSLKDLVRSVQHIEGVGDGQDPFVRTLDVETEMGRQKLKQIYLPNPDGNGFSPIDYEVAQQLITKVTKFYVKDIIHNQEYVRSISPEQYLQDENVPFNQKTREMVRKYLDLVMHAESLSNDSTNKAENLIDNPQMVYEKALSDLEKAKSALLKNPNMSGGDLTTNTEIRAKAQGIINAYNQIQSYEASLFDVEGSLLVNKFPKHQRTTLRKNIRDQIKEFTTRESTNLIAEIAAAGGTVTADAQEEIKARYKQLALTDLSVGRGEAIQTGVTPRTISGLIIDRILGADIYYDSSRDEVAQNATNRGRFYIARPQIDDLFSGLTLPPLSQMPNDSPAQKGIGTLYNIKYDKRILVRFMDRYSAMEAHRVADGMMTAIDIQMDDRNEMRDYYNKFFQQYKYYQQEFARYRMAKSTWEGFGNWTRRIGSAVTVAAIAGIVLAGSPAALTVLIGAYGVTKLVAPRMDQKVSLYANRRDSFRETLKQSMELLAKTKEMYDKGETLNDLTRTQLEQVLLDLNLAGESLQSKGVQENFSPKELFLLDGGVEQLFGKEGWIERALAA